MPSNKELIQQAKALGQQLGKEVRTEGLTNSQLIDLVDDLSDQATEPEVPHVPETQVPTPVVLADGPQEVPSLSTSTDVPPPVNGGEVPSHGGVPKANKPTKPLLPQKFEYQVADGKSITTQKGVVAAGDEVRAKDFLRGQEQLDYLVERGHVRKREPQTAT